MKKILAMICFLACVSCVVKVETETIVGEWRIEAATLTIMGMTTTYDTGMVNVNCEFRDDGTFNLDERLFESSLVPLEGMYEYDAEAGILTYWTSGITSRKAYITFLDLKEIEWNEPVDSHTSFTLRMKRN